MARTSRVLMEMYEAMRRRQGDRRWWPAASEEPSQRALEICVGAILTQNTNWTNVEKAVGNLHAAGAMSIPALAELPAEALAELIRPAGYFNVKAKRLRSFVEHVRASWGADILAFLDRSVAALREELLSINGIGRETADSMILYAAGKPTFVVDTYTHRILVRHGLIDPEDDYEAIKDLLESTLAEDVALWNDFHAQWVEVGKSHCKPKARCAGCPLEEFPHDPQAGREAC